MRKFIFTIFFIAAISAGVYFSFVVAQPNYAMTAIWLTFSLFMFALGWPEVAESISFLGSNIKLREVKNAINELKQLAEVNSKTLLELIQCSNRWGGYTDDERMKTFFEIEKLLKNLDFNEDEIKRIQGRWHYWVEGDYIRGLMHNSNINHPEILPAKHSEWHQKRKEISEKIDHIQPNELRTIFEELGGYTDKVKQVIDDLEYYKRHKKHRDVQKWNQRNEWFI